MCGILGTNYLSQAINDPGVLNLMSHRGPDSTASFIDGNAGLRISRLAIVNTEVDDQPSYGCDEKYVAIFNGEIYNFNELARDLMKLGHKFPKEFSDAQVIPHMFEEYGIEFASKIDGMFAIAIWDKEKQELILFRDSLGIKPLYYHIDESNILFASEIKPLLLMLSISPKLDWYSLNEFSDNNLVSSPRTIFEGIYSLVPGTYLRISSRETQTKRWFKTWPSRTHNAFNKTRLIDELEDLLMKSIYNQVNHGNCKALLLSGGLDSSLIAVLLKRKLNIQVETFHLAYESQIISKSLETSIASNLASELGFEFNKFTLTAKDYFSRLDQVLETFTQPFGGVTSTYFISQEIAKNHKVCLTGDGADELFGSYRKIQIAARHFYEDFNFKSESMNGKESSINEFLHHANNEKKKLFQKNAQVYAIHEDLIDMRKNLNIFDFELLESQLRLLPDQVLLFSDHLGMAHGLEIRPPFLSKEIIEFSRKLPLELLINKEGTTKFILKQLCRRYFSDEFIERKKEGFMLPLNEWLPTKYGEDWITNKFLEYESSSAELIDVKKARKFTEEYFSGYHSQFFRVYRLGVLMHFLSRHDN
jgi:asparagine synthase (glutamine-hydrolysing)